MLNRNDPCWCGSGKKYKKCHLEADAAGAGKAADSPRPKYVKSADEIAGMRRAGEFNGLLMDYIRPYVKAGAVTADLDRLVRDFTLAHGHTSATLGYHGFPKSSCISINNVVCHGIPSTKDILKDGDIVNIDLTSVVDKFMGDSSETFLIGEVAPDARHLVRVTAQAMLRGIASIKPLAKLRDIAEAIEPFVISQGCSVVRQYTGHGIGRRFHENFTVYHHRDRECDDVVFLPGMTLTVEPMINRGRFEVTTDPVDKWTVRTKDGSLSAQFEHTVLVTEKGADILTLTPSQKAAGCTLVVAGLDISEGAQL